MKVLLLSDIQAPGEDLDKNLIQRSQLYSSQARFRDEIYKAPLGVMAAPVILGTRF